MFEVVGVDAKSEQQQQLQQEGRLEEAAATEVAGVYRVSCTFLAKLAAL